MRLGQSNALWIKLNSCCPLALYVAAYHSLILPEPANPRFL
jgi:hypothetical protein